MRRDFVGMPFLGVAGFDERVFLTTLLTTDFAEGDPLVTVFVSGLDERALFVEVGSVIFLERVDFVCG